MGTRRLLTVPECAEYLGITPNAVYHRVSRKQLPVTRLDGRVMFDVRQLDRLIERRTTPARP